MKNVLYCTYRHSRLVFHCNTSLTTKFSRTGQYRNRVAPQCNSGLRSIRMRKICIRSNARVTCSLPVCSSHWRQQRAPCLIMGQQLRCGVAKSVARLDRHGGFRAAAGDDPDPYRRNGSAAPDGRSGDMIGDGDRRVAGDVGNASHALTFAQSCRSRPCLKHASIGTGRPGYRPLRAESLRTNKGT